MLLKVQRMVGFIRLRQPKRLSLGIGGRFLNRLTNEHEENLDLRTSRANTMEVEASEEEAPGAHLHFLRPPIRRRYHRVRYMILIHFGHVSGLGANRHISPPGLRPIRSIDSTACRTQYASGNQRFIKNHYCIEVPA